MGETNLNTALRMRRMRATKSRDGWKQVNVLVPTKSDADDIRSLASEMRKRFRNHPGASVERAETSPTRQLARPAPIVVVKQASNTQCMTRNGQGRMPISLKGFPPLLGRVE